MSLTPGRPAGRLLKRGLIAIAVAAIVLEGAYVVAANVFLNTRLASRTFNRKPQRFQIHWRTAWTLWPGTVSLRGIDVRGRTRRTDWYAHLDSVTTTFDALPLFRRTVHLRSVQAAGVDYRLRHDRPPGSPRAAAPEDLPPIPESLDSPPAEPAARAAPRPHGPPWTILADRIVCDVTALWIDRFRLTGPLRVDTPMSLVVRGPMDFPRVRVTMSAGDLRAGDQAIFAALGLDVDATLHPFVPRSARGPAFFHYLSGRFDLRSESASLAFLETYFKKAPWIRFNTRAAGRAELWLDHGRLRPGTRIEFDNDSVDMVFLDRHLKGKGVITGTVVEVAGTAQSRFTAHLKEFQVAPVGSDAPIARGENATLVASSTALDLGDPCTDLHVFFDLPQARILDLGFYNSMIPAGSGFRLLSGTGTLAYHLEGSHEERSLHGRIPLVVRNGAAEFKGFPIRGHFDLQTELRQASPRELIFDISGTRLDLSADAPSWSGVIRLPSARMRFSDPIAADAAIRLSLQDTRPLVAMFDAFKGVPGWLQSMMIIPDIRGRAAFRLRRDRVDVDDMDITGRGLRALADLTLGKGAMEGILYLRFHGIPLGIGLKPGGRDLKILRPRTWFDRERARRHAERKDADREAP